MKDQVMKLNSFVLFNIFILVVTITGGLFIINSYRKTISLQQTTIDDLKTKIEYLSSQTNAVKSYLRQTSIKKNTALVTVSFYHPKSGGINSDTNPDQTALMNEPIAGYTAAISTALVRKGWLGKKIYIEGLGVFLCHDRMSSRLIGERIDICVGSKKEALENGIQKNVFVSVI